MKNITVIIPAHNEQKNIAKVIRKVKNNKNVNEIIVVDNLSTDKTNEISLKLGAKVIKCEQRGKGYSMEKGLKEAKNEVLVFLDGDIGNYPNDIVKRLTTPILEENIDFVKSTFTRKSGRVTEIVAKPMLDLLFPDLYKFSQPLSGMIAGRKEVLEKINFEKDYGVDIGIVLDVLTNGANVKEVNIGKIKNESHQWRSLNKMSKEVMMAILKRAQKN